MAEKVNSVGLFGNAPIERASPWTSYRIENFPRNYGTLNENLQYCLQAVSPEAISEALKVAAGAAPVAIQASQDNDQNVRSPSTTWIVRFPESHNRLPRALYLFGCRTYVRLLPRRTTIIHCTRCWLWHISRSCAAAPRCSLCGSTQHTKENHGCLCAATGDHVCPPRCIHCHGPHPADSLNCPLRPNQSSAPKSKSQMSGD